MTYFVTYFLPKSGLRLSAERYSAPYRKASAAVRRAEIELELGAVAVCVQRDDEAPLLDVAVSTREAK
jgi:hypothetical protein